MVPSNHPASDMKLYLDPFRAVTLFYNNSSLDSTQIGLMVIIGVIAIVSNRKIAGYSRILHTTVQVERKLFATVLFGTLRLE